MSAAAQSHVDLARTFRSDLPLLAALARIGRLLVRWRWFVVPAVALGFCAYRPTTPVDLGMFAPWGRQIVTGHLAGAYSNPTDQSGPLQLLAAATAPPSVLRTEFQLSVLAAVWSVFIACGSLGLVHVVRQGAGVVANKGLELTAGLLTATFVVGGEALGGHLAELTIPVSWVLAALAMRRRQWGVAGLLLGTSVAWEPWGVLGLPVALLAPELRDAARAAAVALASAVACYVPFLIAGPFRLLKFHWEILPGTLVHTVWPHAVEFGWLPRSVQGGLCIAIGSAVAIGVRKQRGANAIWLVPVAVLMTRFVFDPVQFSYYWVAAQVTLLAGIALVDLRRRFPAVLVMACFWITSAVFGNWQTLDSLVVLALVLVATVVERRQHDPVEGAGPPALPAAGSQPVIDGQVGHADAHHRLA